jgi:hypothetical protein
MKTVRVPATRSTPLLSELGQFLRYLVTGKLNDPNRPDDNPAHRWRVTW